MSQPHPNDEADLAKLLAEVSELRDQVAREGAALSASWAAQAPDPHIRARALNLGHYVALRGHELTSLQYRLAARGLSSLGRSEANVIPALQALIATLTRLNGKSSEAYPEPTAMRAGGAALNVEAERVLGRLSKGAPRARIMATLPPEAATDRTYVETLMATGMNCARINCAHDNVKTWGAMIDNIRAAEAKLQMDCRVLMDIAGPKCRVNAVNCPPKYRVNAGEKLAVRRKLAGESGGLPHFTISFPEIIDQLVVGAEVFFDDGRAAARVTALNEDGAELLVYASREKGVRLKVDKGLNFPSIELELPTLTDKDFSDLEFVAERADLVGFSFVQRAGDVEKLQDELARRRRDQPPQAIVLKIETPLAIRNLPELILQSLARNPTAVMIARGDLAVEIGFARLSEMQEEILWLCEAAHTPVIWATQVLDQFVRDGVASRSEMTDAAMAQGAECVMLNKGAHLIEGVAFLRDVLLRMDRHHAKKFARYTQLRAWNDGGAAAGR